MLLPYNKISSHLSNLINILLEKQSKPLDPRSTEEYRVSPVQSHAPVLSRLRAQYLSSALWIGQPAIVVSGRVTTTMVRTGCPYS